MRGRWGCGTGVGVQCVGVGACGVQCVGVAVGVGVSR